MTQTQVTNMLECEIAETIMNPAPRAPLLSIIIPTYNRAAYLPGTLDGLCAQIQNNLHDQIEVIISDNASTDTTPEIARAYAAKYPFVSYIRHAENQGTARQLFLGPQRARCPYVWMFGDDDGLADGALAHILEIIQTQNVDFISLNREVRDRDMKTVLTPQANTVPARRFDGFADFLRAFSPYQLGFISAQILKCAPYNRIDPTHYITTEGYLHIPSYMEAYRDSAVYYCDRPLVIYRFNNFKDTEKALSANIRSLTLPLMRALDVVCSRCGYPKDIAERIGGEKSTTSYDDSARVWLSDTFLEKLLQISAKGYAFSDSEWQDMHHYARHWRPAAQAMLHMVHSTASQMQEMLKAKADAEAKLAPLKRRPSTARTKQEMLPLQNKIRDLQFRVNTAIQQMEDAALVIGQSGAEVILNHVQAA